MNEIVTVNDVAHSFSGVIQSRLPVHPESPTLRLINIKDIQEGEIAAPDLLDSVSAVVPEQQMLRMGDLLVSIRGTLLKMAIVTEAHEGMLATSNLAVLRPKPDKILPEVLQAVLQGENIGTQLRMQASGTTIKGLQLASIRAVRFVNPPLLKQRHIAELVRVSEAQRRAAIRVADERLDIARAVIASHLEIK